MMRVPAGKGGQSSVIHTGNEEGFARNSLLLFQSKLKGSYHNQTDGQKFRKYFCQKVIMNCRKELVTPMDVSYHSVKL
jgi:hypothetical protein